MAEDYRTSTVDGAAAYARWHAEPYDDGGPSEADLIEDHECEEHVENDGIGGYFCNVCQRALDERDMECSICGTYPCHCDEAYERWKDART